MNRRLKQVAVVFFVVFAGAQLVRPARVNPPMARTVAEGRKAVNFSEWNAYSPDQQRALLAASCDDAAAGRKTGPWRRLRPETRLSAQDIGAICAAGRQAEAREVQP